MKATIFIILLELLRRSAPIEANETHEPCLSCEDSSVSSSSSPCSSVSSSTSPTIVISPSTTVSQNNSISKKDPINSIIESILPNSNDNIEIISQNPDCSSQPSQPSQTQNEQNQNDHTVSSTNEILDFSKINLESSDSRTQESEIEYLSTHISSVVYDSTTMQPKEEMATLENQKLWEESSPSFWSYTLSLHLLSDSHSQESSASQKSILSSSATFISSTDSVSKSSHSVEASSIELAAQDDISSQGFSSPSSSAVFSEIKSSISSSSNPPNYLSPRSFDHHSTELAPTTETTKHSDTKNTETSVDDLKQETLIIESPESLIQHHNITGKERELDAENDHENDKAYFMSFEEWKKIKVDENEINNINQKSSRSVNKNIHENQNSPQELSDHLNGPIGDDMELDISMFGVSPKDLEGKIYKDRFNYASFDCAATIIKTNSKAKKASAILNENKDSYLLNECSVANKFVIIELCEDILVDEVAIANYEFFSSGFKKLRFSVSGKFPVPANGWKVLGEFTAKNSRELQNFSIKNPFIWARYFKIEILSHYGNEYFCPISTIQVHGKTMMEKFKMEEEEQIGDLIDSESTDNEDIIEDGLVEGQDQHLLQDYIADIDKLNKVTENIDIKNIKDVADKSIDHMKTNRETEDVISDGYLTRKTEIDIISHSESLSSENSNHDSPDSTELEKGSYSDNTYRSSDTIKIPNISQKVKFEPSNSSKQKSDKNYKSNMESTTNQSSEKESDSRKKKYQLDLLDVKELNDACSVNITFMEISQFFKYRVNDLCIPDEQYDGSEKFRNAETTDKAPTEDVDGGINKIIRSNTPGVNDNVSTVIGNTKNANPKSRNSRPASNNYGDEPTTQESIYRNIIKRISMLETNATLSLLYIEEQSKILSKAFESLENRQKTKFDILVSALNSTFHDRIQKLVSINENMSTEYRMQQIKLNHQTETQLYHLNSELVFQKRLVLFNTILIVCLLVYVIVSRDTYIETEIADGYYGNDYDADNYNDNRSLEVSSNRGKHSRVNSGYNSDASYVSSDYNPGNEGHNGGKGGSVYSYDYNENDDHESEFDDQDQHTGDVASNPTSAEDYTYNDYNCSDNESSKGVRFSQQPKYIDNNQFSPEKQREAISSPVGLQNLSDTPVKTKVVRVSLGHKLFSPVSGLSQAKYYSRFFSPSKDYKKQRGNSSITNDNSTRVQIDQQDNATQIPRDPAGRISSEFDDSYQRRKSISSDSKDNSKPKGKSLESVTLETVLKPHNLGNSDCATYGIGGIDGTEANDISETNGTFKDDTNTLNIDRNDRTPSRTPDNSSKASLVRLKLGDLKSEMEDASDLLLSDQVVSKGETDKKTSNKIFPESSGPVNFGISDMNVQLIEEKEESVDFGDDR
ncbi:hypothetical protein B5S28_g2488 [[Candida] boidinii]|nr:hypothetical protein B5S28_g2488 [[Candida] boidinii]